MRNATDPTRCPCRSVDSPARRSLLGGLSARVKRRTHRRSPRPRRPPRRVPDWPSFAAAFIESRFKADPYFAVQSGRHEFDGQMPDWSRAALEAEVAELQRQLEQLGEIRSRVADHRHSASSAAISSGSSSPRSSGRWTRSSRFAIPPGTWRNWILPIYLTREYAPLPQRLQGFLGYARAIPRLAAEIRANLRTPLPRPFIERGVAAFGGYAAFYRSEMPAIVAQLDDEARKRELTEATAAAATCHGRTRGWLEVAARPPPAMTSRWAPRNSRKCCASPSTSMCRSRSSSWSDARTSSAISAALAAGLRGLRAKGQRSRPASTDACRQACWRHGGGRARATRRSCGNS